MRALILWIGSHTGYDVEDALTAPPEITFCEPGETIPYETDSMLVGPGDRGIYDRSHRRIHLVRPWDPDDPLARGYLLHELVHDIQFMNRSWPCDNATEAEAYRLHDRWLAEHGIASGFDWLWVQLRARCPRDVHP